jgi:hypothetical protein
MNRQAARTIAAKNDMYLYYVRDWNLWCIYHLTNLRSEYISPHQLRKFSQKDFNNLINTVRGGA